MRHRPSKGADGATRVSVGIYDNCLQRDALSAGADELLKALGIGM